MRSSRVLLSLVLIALTACSGKSGPSSVVPVPIASAPVAGAGVPVAFTMHWTSAVASSVGRRPAYVPATARSVSVAVNGGTPQYLNSPGTSLSISAPAGVDTFAIVTYDEQNGQGNALSQADVTQTVVAATANVLSATLNGVIASLKVSLGSPNTNAGTSASMPIDVAALDADGNTIVGPGDYSSPVNLAIDDPSSSGTLSLSVPVIQAPGGAAPTLTYNGGTLVGASIVASAAGAAGSSATIAPKPTFYEYPTPTSGSSPEFIVRGPDGNMWFTEALGNQIGKITPAGAITEYPVVSGGIPVGLTVGKDGALWFTEINGSKIGRITTAGAIQEFPAVDPGAQPFGIAERGDGTLWYTESSPTNAAIRVSESAPTVALDAVALPGSPSFSMTTAPNGSYYVGLDGQGVGVFDGVATTQLPVGPSLSVHELALGPNGNIWESVDSLNLTSNSIQELSPATNTIVATHPIPIGDGITVITFAADGTAWFGDAGSIGHLAADGSVTDYRTPSTTILGGVATARDGTIWACETSTNAIARFVY